MNERSGSLSADSMVSQFLNPKATLTPGIAGFIAMFISNTLCFTFERLEFRFVALTVSLLIGLITFTASDISIIKRMIYYLINSLIVFSMAIGYSNVGYNISSRYYDNRISLTETAQYSLMSNMSTIREAFAASDHSMSNQTSRAQNCEDIQSQLEQCQKSRNDLVAHVKKLEADRDKLESTYMKRMSVDKPGFFRTW